MRTRSDRNEYHAAADSQNQSRRSLSGTNKGKKNHDENTNERHVDRDNQSHVVNAQMPKKHKINKLRVDESFQYNDISAVLMDSSQNFEYKAHRKRKRPIWMTDFIAEPTSDSEAVPSQADKEYSPSVSSSDTEDMVTEVSVVEIDNYKSDATVVCSVCQKSISQKNIARHKLKSCKGAFASSTIRCLICSGVVVGRLLKNHARRCKVISVREDQPDITDADFDSQLMFPIVKSTRQLRCPICNERFSKVPHLHDHLVIQHQYSLRRRFESKESFEAWFSETNLENNLVSRGDKEKAGTLYRYYDCRQNLRQPRQCPCHLNLIIKPNEVVATYHNVHTHPETIGRKISAECQSFIIQALHEGFSNRQILSAVQERFLPVHVNHLKLTSIANMRHRHLKVPLTTSSLDLDVLENGVEEVDYSVFPSTGPEFEPERLRESQVDASETELNSSTAVPQGEVQPSPENIDTPARRFIRCHIVPMLLNALDDPSISENQWEQIGAQCSTIINTIVTRNT